MHASLLALTLCLLASPTLLAQETSAPINGRLEVVEGQRTLTLWGTPAERGRAHGVLLARDLKTCIETDFTRFLETAGLTPKVYESLLLKGVVPGFQFDPDEIAEMEGILAGMAEALSEEERVIELLGRPMHLGDLKAINTVGDWTSLSCSTVAFDGALTPSGFPAVVRNFDYPAMLSLLQMQHVVVVRPTEEGRIGYAGVSHPGGIGIMTGMNAQGVFVSVHDVHVKPSLTDAMKRNVPRLVALRRLVSRVRAAGAVEQAQGLLKGWPTLYGNNIFVVTRTRNEDQPFAGVFEYDKRKKLEGGVTLRRNDAMLETDESFLVCTNHFRKRGFDDSESPRSRCRRYRALTTRLRGDAMDPAEVTSDGQPGATVKYDLAGLTQILDLAAVPRAERKQTATSFGTLHQSIGLTGPVELHVRMGRVGANIRDESFRAVKVLEVLAEARPKAAATTGG